MRSFLFYQLTIFIVHGVTNTPAFHSIYTCSTTLIWMQNYNTQDSISLGLDVIFPLCNLGSTSFQGKNFDYIFEPLENMLTIFDVSFQEIS